jgi:hypothetical protein
MQRRTALNLGLGLVVLIALAGVLVYHHGSASSSTASPTTSPRAAAASFGAAYLRVLGGSQSGAGLPDTTASVRAHAAQAARIPAAYRSGPVRLSSVQTRWVTGADVAQARIVGRDHRHTYLIDLDLTYSAGGWRVVYVVPPDLATILAPPRHAPTVAQPLRAAAHAFALAYANYREGASIAPPPGLPSIQGQIHAGSDPLAQTPPTHVPANLESLAFGPVQGNVVAASATLSDRGNPLSFSFNLMRTGSQWRAWSFPETSG